MLRRHSDASGAADTIQRITVFVEIARDTRADRSLTSVLCHTVWILCCSWLSIVLAALVRWQVGKFASYVLESLLSYSFVEIAEADCLYPSFKAL